MLRNFLLALTIGLSLPYVLIFNCFAGQPQYGGTLRVLGGEAMVLGYPPEMGYAETAGAFPAVESLMECGPDRKLSPFLAESADIDPDNLTITFHLRKGIKFHDGSDFDADAVAYNFQLLGESGRLQYWDNVASVDKPDAHTVRLCLTKYNNMMIQALSLINIFSKRALTTQSVDWLRGHPVGTGPFKLSEWKRGSHIRWEKNPNYWQKDRPFLDAVEIRFVADPMTAAMMMENQEADLWLFPPVNQVLDLEKKGLKRMQWFAASPIVIFLNTKNSDRPTSKKKVRQAIEFALDKKAMAHAIGRELFEPLKMVAPEGEWGHDPDYAGRQYNPDLAKQLLKDAGYTLPVKLKLTAVSRDLPDALKSYMDQAGFEIEIDSADVGRYYDSMFFSGWPDMLISLAGPDPNFLVTFQRWFGHDPPANLVSFQRPPGLLALSKAAVTYCNEADQRAATKKLVRMLADEALVIPIYTDPHNYIVQPYVHCSFMQEPFRWRIYDDWMEKH